MAAPTVYTYNPTGTGLRNPGGSVSSTGGAPAPSGGLGSTFSLYNSGVTPKPVTVQRPTIGEFGDPGPRPVIGQPTRDSYGVTSHAAKMGYDQATFQAHQDAAGFNDPTKTAAFKNLMNLESEQGATVAGEVARHSRDAASRAGYSGGFHADERQAQQDRFQAIAQGGMQASAQVRGEELDKYKADASNQTALANAINEQTGASDRAFGSDLAAAARGQGELDLGFGKLIQDRNLSYADAQQEASKLQAQLDSAFQGQLIDAGRYNQISASVQAQLALAQAKQKEDTREFDLTRADQHTRDAAAQTEIDRQRTERGVDSATGKKYGSAYTPGQAFHQLGR